MTARAPNLPIEVSGRLFLMAWQLLKPESIGSFV
jgi:hypothetical protein